MAQSRTTNSRIGVKLDLALRLYNLRSPEIAETVAKLHAQYGKYALPDQEARKVVDQAMGEKSLTEELYAMRQE